VKAELLELLRIYFQPSKYLRTERFPSLTGVVTNPAGSLTTNIGDLSTLPTSSVGLAVGKVWIDTTAGNVIKVVL